jgi:hypothetical protein
MATNYFKCLSGIKISVMKVKSTLAYTGVIFFKRPIKNDNYHKIQNGDSGIL